MASIAAMAPNYDAAAYGAERPGDTSYARPAPTVSSIVQLLEGRGRGESADSPGPIMSAAEFLRISHGQDPFLAPTMARDIGAGFNPTSLPIFPGSRVAADGLRLPSARAATPSPSVQSDPDLDALVTTIDALRAISAAGGAPADSLVGSTGTALSGALNLAQGIQRENPLQATRGGVGAVAGAARALNQPTVAELIAGLAGPLGLVTGFTEGRPQQVVQGAGGTINLAGNAARLLNATGLVPNTAGPTLRSLGAGMAGHAPASIAANAGGLIGTGLGIAGQLAGDEDVTRAGQLVGSASSLYGLGSGIASAAGTGASLGAGAAAGIAGGALAIPGIVELILNNFVFNKTHYDKTRMKANAQAKGSVAALNDIYGQAVQNPQLLREALSMGVGENGAVRSSFAPPAEVAASLGLSGSASGHYAWGSLTPEQFTAAMQWIAQDPARLSAVGGSGDIPYVEQRDAQRYADQAADYARNAIASALGLPYFFVDPEHRLKTGIVKNQWGGVTGAPDEETLSIMARKEAGHQQARDAWAKTHPGVALPSWSPEYLGREDYWRQMRQAEEQQLLQMAP